MNSRENVLVMFVYYDQFATAPQDSVFPPTFTTNNEEELAHKSSATHVHNNEKKNPKKSTNI